MIERDAKEEQKALNKDAGAAHYRKCSSHEEKGHKAKMEIRSR